MTKSFKIMALGLLMMISGTAQAGTLSSGLELQLSSMSDDDIVKVLVVMREQADIQTLDKNLSLDKAGLAERHAAVIGALREVSNRTQKGLLLNLDDGKKTGAIKGYVPHWLINAVVVTAEVKTVRQLALRDDVDTIEADLQIEPIEPIAFKPMAPAAKDTVLIGLLDSIKAINAHRVWSELGIDGTGTLVANIDSGVEGTHQWLTDHWRGNFAPHEECWLDIAGYGATEPEDYVGHGTHTMGTMTGWAETDSIGVAPGAQWIATNALLGGAIGMDNAIFASFEFLTDPDGDPATLDDVPDVVNNSWGVSELFDGYFDCDSRWWDAIDNCEAAGVVLIFAAGNEGQSGAGTLRSPPDRATSPTNCFAVGSTGQYPPYDVSIFSARGPSGCGGEYATKPEVVAPGEAILSATTGDWFGYSDGTSMAAPHISGTVALMRQANPDLDVVTIKQTIIDTARDLGYPGEDNDSGYGIIDAYAAVSAVMTGIGTIDVTVTDPSTGLSVEGADVVLLDGFGRWVTRPDGTFRTALRPGPVEFEITKFGYHATTLQVEIVNGQVAYIDTDLNQAPWAMISGTVFDPDGQPIPGAIVAMRDIPVEAVVTDAVGHYEVSLPALGDRTYFLRATAPDLAYDTKALGLYTDIAIDFNLTHVQGDGFESGGFLTLPWQLGGAETFTIDTTDRHEGFFSTRSGTIGHGQQTELALDYYVNGDGVLAFWFKTSSEIYYDALNFYIDGLLIETWSGVTDWGRYAVDVTDGWHTFGWAYAKDSSISVGQDCAWIDLIELPGTGVQPLARIAMDVVNVAVDIEGSETLTAPLSFRNTGYADLEYTVSVAGIQDTAGLVLPAPQDIDMDWLRANGLVAGAGKSETPSWVTVTPAAGVVPPRIGTDLDVKFTALHQPDGTHIALATLTCNDVDQPVTTVPLIMTVSNASAVGDDDLPRQVELRGAVPNPFNPMTDIHFNLPQRADVSLRIYDISGRLVQTLLAENLTAGSHQARWDGRDRDDQEVASGVYFARLVASGEVSLKSMVLVR